MGIESQSERAYDYRVAIITGATRGIGRACALALAHAHYHIVFSYQSETPAGKAAALGLVEEIEGGSGGKRSNVNGVRAIGIRADVGLSSSAALLVDTAMAHFGRVDVLVNNAALAQSKLMTDITEAEWDRMVAVNLSGPFFMCQEAARVMVSQRFGTIINISSIWGMVGASCEVHYSATKAGLIGLTQALAKELGPSQVRVNCLAPGCIATDMLNDFSDEDLAQIIDETPLMRLGSPQDIAHWVVFLASDQASFMTGQVISPNGGMVI